MPSHRPLNPGRGTCAVPVVPVLGCKLPVFLRLPPAAAVPLWPPVPSSPQQAPAVLIMWVDTTSVRCYHNYRGIEVDSRLIRCK